MEDKNMQLKPKTAANFVPYEVAMGGSQEKKLPSKRSNHDHQKENIPLKVRRGDSSSPDLIIIDDSDNSDEEQVIVIPDNEVAEKPRLMPSNREIVPKKRTNKLLLSTVWTTAEVLAESANIDRKTAGNIVKLFEDDNTIPFLCRYRRDMINHMDPERMRAIKDTYLNILTLRKKLQTTIQQLHKDNILTTDIQQEISSARSLEELDYLTAAYKTPNRGTLADKAIALGLEEPAIRLLHGGTPMVNIASLVNRKNPSLDTLEKVISGICNIMSLKMAKLPEVYDKLRCLKHKYTLYLQTTKVKTKGDKSQPLDRKAQLEEEKYQTYHNYRCDINNLKPHQILAINRGEKQKLISVSVLVTDSIMTEVKTFLSHTYFWQGLQYEERAKIIERAFKECYTKKLKPFLCRHVRSELNELARKASVNVFARNVKQVLLTLPQKGQPIMGIDPGFTNGCKYAIISETAEVVASGVLYPHVQTTDPETCGEKLAKTLIKHSCSLIALGNGTACRETEMWLTKLFELTILDPATVRYCIVSEQGASIYSCSPTAKTEFPNMDPNIISAVSIARRLNDPLSEYVKLQPKHLGVGMYQHDLAETQLKNTMDEVISECVSYVGVDLNTASHSLLKHIAGLSDKRAECILDYRMKNGPFRRKKDLFRVKLIGEKTFTQCAGFLRIDPRTLNGTVENPLDTTWVHPEMYNVANKIIRTCGLRPSDIGKSDFIKSITRFKENKMQVQYLIHSCNVPEDRIAVVLQALQSDPFKDYRTELNQQPLFKKGIKRIIDLKVGSTVTGIVTNVTDFGAFVDIGVERDILMHQSQTNGVVLNVGYRVSGTICKLDVKRQRINMSLTEVLNQ